MLKLMQVLEWLFAHFGPMGEAKRGEARLLTFADLAPSGLQRAMEQLPPEEPLELSIVSKQQCDGHDSQAHRDARL